VDETIWRKYSAEAECSFRTNIVNKTILLWPETDHSETLIGFAQFIFQNSGEFFLHMSILNRQNTVFAIISTKQFLRNLKQLPKLRKATECLEATSATYLKTGDGKRFTASPPTHHSLRDLHNSCQPRPPLETR
jgi:hypothetical protein